MLIGAGSFVIGSRTPLVGDGGRHATFGLASRRAPVRLVDRADRGGRAARAAATTRRCSAYRMRSCMMAWMSWYSGLIIMVMGLLWGAGADVTGW
jgi:hypothetical protein